MCVSFCLCMSVHHLHAHCPPRLEGARFSAIRVTDGCELLCAGNQTQALLKNIWFLLLLLLICFGFFCFVFNLKFTLFSVYGCFACMSVYHMHAVPMQAIRGH